MQDLDDWAAPMPHVLTVPGLNNSGPDHWQSIWERETPWLSRVDLGLWERPQRNVWVTRLSQAIRSSRAPVVLCAHSLGCLAVAWWAALEGQSYAHPVAGALLVAPPDCERALVNQHIAGFGPVPRVILPFPTILVASQNDPYASIERSIRMAELWGAAFVDVGELGHINAQSNLGDWPEGRMLLNHLIDGGPRVRQNRSGVAALREGHRASDLRS
ncbi:MAG TPA: alpha/beta hydrolase [Sphingobium sp.]|nr:alpha/beta hydrolase [Sphingobium sp.]